MLRRGCDTAGTCDSICGRLLRGLYRGMCACAAVARVWRATGAVDDTARARNHQHSVQAGYPDPADPRSSAVRAPCNVQGSSDCCSCRSPRAMTCAPSTVSFSATARLAAVHRGSCVISPAMHATCAALLPSRAIAAAAHAAHGTAQSCGKRSVPRPRPADTASRNVPSHVLFSFFFGFLTKLSL